jgi:deferrochelatase/peroxidase EfeB
MTGQQLLSEAIALFDATDAGYYADTAPHAINLLLAETFDINNSIRRLNGETALAAVPELSGLAETLPYDDRLVRRAFPYGLAEKLSVGERDTALLSYFHQMYLAAAAGSEKGFARVVSCAASI